MAFATGTGTGTGNAREWEWTAGEYAAAPWTPSSYAWPTPSTSSTSSSPSPSPFSPPLSPLSAHPPTSHSSSSLPLSPPAPYPPEYSIFVGDLAPETSNSDLVAVFRNPVLGLRSDRAPKLVRPFPSCRSAKIMLDPVTGVSRGYGFVRFGDEADQQRALVEMHGLYCLSRPMRISPATAKTKPPPAVSPLPLPASVSAPLAAAPTSTIPPDSDWTHHAQARAILGNLLGPNGEQLTSTDPYNTTVFVGGLSPLVGEDVLRGLFLPFGDIHYVKVPAGKNCGFVQFVRKSDAERAIEGMQGCVVGGSRMRLSWGRSQYKAAQAAALQASTPFQSQQAQSQSFQSQQAQSQFQPQSQSQSQHLPQSHQLPSQPLSQPAPPTAAQQMLAGLSKDEIVMLLQQALLNDAPPSSAAHPQSSTHQQSSSPFASSSDSYRPPVPPPSSSDGYRPVPAASEPYRPPVPARTSPPLPLPPAAPPSWRAPYTDAGMKARWPAGDGAFVQVHGQGRRSPFDVNPVPTGSGSAFGNAFGNGSSSFAPFGPDSSDRDRARAWQAQEPIGRPRSGSRPF